MSLCRRRRVSGARVEFRFKSCGVSALLQLSQDLAGDGLKRFKNAHALKGDRLDDGLVALPKLLLERIERHGVGQVALIELQHVRDLLEIVAVLAKILLQVLKRLDIGVHAFFLGVRHENDTVYATQDQPAAGIVEDLAGYRVKVDAG